MNLFPHLTEAEIDQRLMKLAKENGGVLTNKIVVRAAQADARRAAEKDALYAHRIIANACAGGLT